MIEQCRHRHSADSRRNGGIYLIFMVGGYYHPSRRNRWLMKGVIFNLFEDVVSRERGEAAWDAILDMARLSGSYTSLGNYEDGELASLVEAAANILETPPADVLRRFGRAAMPLLFERYPQFFVPHSNCLDFVMTLNAIIHPEVMVLYPGARCPWFDNHVEPGGGLVLAYDSPRRLCMLAHGFIEGAADHYRQEVAVQHLSCMHDGDAECRMRISAD